MGWHITKQPDGRFARFSSVVDGFTHADLTAAEAFKICAEKAGLEEARKKIENAEGDVLPPGYVKQGKLDGLNRWRCNLRTIAACLGRETLRETLDEFSWMSEEDRKRWYDEACEGLAEEPSE